MPAANCLFCRIASGEISATILRSQERTVAFRDVSPVGPVHVLVIPRSHHADLAAAVAAEPDLPGLLLAEATQVAADEGLLETGYRVVVNTGDDGGQSVHHLHLHVIGGRRMTWPPG